MFKFLSGKDQFARQCRKVEMLSTRQDSVESASSITFVALAETGAINETVVTEHSDLFPKWTKDTTYEVGAIRLYENNLYRCIQAHTSQNECAPNDSISLWTKVGDPTVGLTEELTEESAEE